MENMHPGERNQSVLGHLLGENYQPLLHSREFKLSPFGDLSLLCGEKSGEGPDDSEFVYRFLALNKRQQPAQVSCVELSEESFEKLSNSEASVYRVLDEGLKSIIFQNLEIQVYVREAADERGFVICFEDKLNASITMNVDSFRKLMIFRDSIHQELLKYKSRKNPKSKKRTNALPRSA